MKGGGVCSVSLRERERVRAEEDVFGVILGLEI